MWALSYYLTQLSLGCQSSCQKTPRGLETRCGREGHTRPRGSSETPDGVDPNIRRTRKTQRDGHNSGVKIWSLCSVSSILSHANLSNPCNKVRGEYFSKEVFLRLPSFMCLNYGVVVMLNDDVDDFITLVLPTYCYDFIFFFFFFLYSILLLIWLLFFYRILFNFFFIYSLSDTIRFIHFQRFIGFYCVL